MLWMYSLPRATDIAELMCARVIDVDSTAYTAFRLSSLRGWSRRVSDSGQQGDTPKLSLKTYVPSEDSRL